MGLCTAGAGAVPRPGLERVGRAESLCGPCSVGAVPRAVDDDVCLLLPWFVGVGWASSRALPGTRAVEMTGALSGAVARAVASSVVLLRVVVSIGAGVPMLLLLLQVTVHLPVSPQLFLELLHC